MSLVIAGILGLVLFCAAVIALSIYRKWKIELEIEGLLWKIEPHEIFGYFGNDIVNSPSKVRGHIGRSLAHGVHLMSLHVVLPIYS